MTYSLSQRSRDNLTGVHPDLVRIVEGAIVSSAVDFGITGKAVRTAAEQAALFRQGVTQKDGYKSKSNHQPHADGWGHAVDFGITGKAMRTAAEQAALFRQGVTQKDGYKSKSNHQAHADGWGHAVDLTPYLDGKPILDDRAWALYPALASAMSLSAKALGLASRLKWGCNWLETMDLYGSDPADMTAAMDRYKHNHPGKDFIDGPHFELS